MEIKGLSKKYIKSLAALEKECFSTPWSEKLFTDDLSNENAEFFLAVKNDEVLGYVGLYNILGDGYITDIAVFEKYRKQGIATELIVNLLRYAKQNNMNFVTLEVRKSNLKAINLYTKMGFHTVGERKNYYTNPVEDAVLMTKEGNEF